MEEICEFCEKPCKRILVDFGIGNNEFWGRLENHKDLQYVSDCCEAPLYPPYYEDYLDIPEYYWEYE